MAHHAYINTAEIYYGNANGDANGVLVIGNDVSELSFVLSLPFSMEGYLPDYNDTLELTIFSVLLVTSS